MATHTLRARNLNPWAPLVAVLLSVLGGCGGGGGDAVEPVASPEGATAQAGDPQSAGEPSTAEPAPSIDEPPGTDQTLAAPLQQSSEALLSEALPSAALRPCWNTPNRWMGQVDGKDTDALNLIVCLGHGVTWSQVFDALEDLPGRKFDRPWPWPSIRVPWREVRAPATPPYRDGHCINGVQASLDRRGWLEQGFSGREEGCGSIFRSKVNHFRVWQQTSSAALFIGASTDSPCFRDYVKPSHCVDSYDGGRALLYADLLKAAANARLKTDAAWFTAVAGGGSLKQADGGSVRYDGKVWVVWISR